MNISTMLNQTYEKHTLRSSPSFCPNTHSNPSICINGEEFLSWAISLWPLFCTVIHPCTKTPLLSRLGIYTVVRVAVWNIRHRCLFSQYQKEASVEFCTTLFPNNWLWTMWFQRLYGGNIKASSSINPWCSLPTKLRWSASLYLYISSWRYRMFLNDVTVEGILFGLRQYLLWL